VIIVVPYHPGRTVERSYVVPSALRTLSVVTLLSAVSGTVLLLNTHHHARPAATTAEVTRDGDASASAALSSSLISSPLISSPLISATQTKGLMRARARAWTLAAAKAEVVSDRQDRKAEVVSDRQDRNAEVVSDRQDRQDRERASRSARRDPKTVAQIMVDDRGWGSGQFSCLSLLWNRESRWNPRASNPSSGAYGIPQALPGRKMASAGPDWRTNPVTQIRWGLNYIADRYGTPCGAWGHSQASGWY
jgi:hypothetical protein